MDQDQELRARALNQERMEFNAWHEQRMSDLGYFDDILWELREARTKMLASWTPRQ